MNNYVSSLFEHSFRIATTKYSRLGKYICSAYAEPYCSRKTEDDGRKEKGSKPMRKEAHTLS